MTFFLQSALALGLPPAVVTFIGLVLAWGAAKRERRFVSRCLTGFAVAFGYARRSSDCDRRLALYAVIGRALASAAGTDGSVAGHP
jgi:hypothetical protein